MSLTLILSCEAGTNVAPFPRKGHRGSFIHSRVFTEHPLGPRTVPGLGLSSLSGWEIGDSSQIPWAGGSVGSWDFILRELEVLEGFGHTGDID